MDERKRLIQIMESEEMNAKQFSQEVGISPGTLSNIMGGRNKPSLEVMQAILNRFRNIQSDWLILGVGSMYRPSGGSIQTSLFDIKPQDSSDEKETNVVASIATDTTHSSFPTTTPKYHETTKQVAKILVLYTDGSFEER